MDPKLAKGVPFAHGEAADAVGSVSGARVGLGELLRDLAAQFRAAPRIWRQTAWGLAAAVVLISLLGVFYDTTGNLSLFQVSGELTQGFYVPVLFSFDVLLMAGVAAGGQSRWAATRTERVTWIGLGVLFTFMACDELLTIHETLEEELGVDWQVLYAPVILLGAAAWFGALMRFERWSLEWVMWIAAAALWSISQILEKLEYDASDNTVAGFTAMNDTEKVLQFTGSALFLLVALLALERVRRRPDAP